MNAIAANAGTPTSRRLEQAQLACFLLMLCAGNFSVAIGQITLGLTLLLALVRRIGPWGGPGIALPSTGMERVTLALFGWAVLMIPFSADPGQSLVFSKRFFMFTALWLGADLARDEGRRRLLFGALLSGAVAISLVSVVQMHRQFGSLFAVRLNLVSNPMTNGALLMLVVLLGLGVLLSRTTPGRARLVVAALVAPVLLALLMTMTRSALLGLIAGVGMMLLVGRPRWFLVAAAAAVAAAVVLAAFGGDILPPRLWSRINPAELTGGINTTTRVEMWRVGWQMVKAHPWTGVGDCDLLAVAPAYYGDLKPVPFGHLHSNFVHLAVIWGVPGFILAMAFLFNQPRLLLRRWRDRPAVAAPWRQGWILGALGMWVGFFVAGATEWYFGDAEPMLLFMAITGVALGGRRQDTRSGESHD